MKTLYVLFCLVPLVFSTGCALQAQLTPAEANSAEGDTNLGSSQSGFTAVFKANNTHLLGVYDENTTAATISGSCKPGDLITILSGEDLIKNKSVFCSSDGTWSAIVNLSNYPGYSTIDANAITASTRGSTNASASVLFTYSPTALPSLGAGTDISTYGGKTTLSFVVGGQAGTIGLSNSISHIGLTQKRQYKYRIEIYRSGSSLLNLGELTELSTRIEITSPYTWQNGDTIKVTPFDSSGDQPSISISIPDPQGVAA
ncbi:hypothetical protein [Bdellovibrio bacteriovorus]|uniref:hypothetical protein n=1 Tax=Bdellovibrio bacteriovorus TaxID=959 RepID=UPI0035A63D85